MTLAPLLSGLSAAAVLAAICLAAPGARAVPLTEAACERYAAERSMLRRLGAGANLSRGAAWAQQNLTQPELDLIHRYIRLDEALRFRCPERYATLREEISQAPRRLDVIPPAPTRKPSDPLSAQGLSQTRPPPPPSAKPAREQS